MASKKIPSKIRDSYNIVQHVFCTEKCVTEWDPDLRIDGTVPYSTLIATLLDLTKKHIASNDELCKWQMRGIDYVISDLDLLPITIMCGDMVTYSISREHSVHTQRGHTIFHCCACVDHETILTIDFAFVIGKASLS